MFGRLVRITNTTSYKLVDDRDECIDQIDYPSQPTTWEEVEDPFFGEVKVNDDLTDLSCIDVEINNNTWRR